MSLEDRSASKRSMFIIMRRVHDCIVTVEKCERHMLFSRSRKPETIILRLAFISVCMEKGVTLTPMSSYLSMHHASVLHHMGNVPARLTRHDEKSVMFRHLRTAVLELYEMRHGQERVNTLAATAAAFSQVIKPKTPSYFIYPGLLGGL